MCGYLGYTGELRGCDPGPGCKRYLKWRNHHNRGKAPTWDVETGRKMWSEGYSDSYIGKKLGVSRETVAEYRRRNWGAVNRERKKGAEKDGNET
jgi:hypothetical protein